MRVLEHGGNGIALWYHLVRSRLFEFNLFIHVVGVYSLSLLHDVPLSEQDHSVFYYPPANRHWGGCQSFTVTHNTAEEIVNASSCTWADGFLGHSTGERNCWVVGNGHFQLR